MQGMIISNPKLEFLRPVLERWFDCIDRYNAVRGDNDTPYWHDEKANLGLLSAAAWMAELVTLSRALDQLSADGLIRRESDAADSRATRVYITEAGRAMTAHHAMMVVNVSEVEQAPDGDVPDARTGEPLVIKHLRDLVRSIDRRTRRQARASSMARGWMRSMRGPRPGREFAGMVAVDAKPEARAPRL